MPKAEDPFYNRKPVPDSLIEDIGLTGLSTEEELANREKKLSVGGVDVRKFWNSKKHYDDPYYGRKSVDRTNLEGVGETGLSPDEADLNRERKLSVNGVDVRKFWNSKKHYDDPYYGRKSVANNETIGVGETGMTKAEEYDSRERKQSVFQLDTDPFSQLTGSGHRQSVSAQGLGYAQDATTRRRSSVNPMMATKAAGGQHNNTYGGQQGGQHTDTINSAPSLPPVGSGGVGNNYHMNSNTTTTTTTNTSHHTGGAAGQATYYDTATARDPDDVDPMDRR